MLAAPITRENAADYARRATISREANRAARKVALEQSHAKPPIEPEIHRIVKAMSKLPILSDDYKELAKILSDLWNKAFPTQGATRARSRRDSQSPVEPITPQVPPV